MDSYRAAEQLIRLVTFTDGSTAGWTCWIGWKVYPSLKLAGQMLTDAPTASLVRQGSNSTYIFFYLPSLSSSALLRSPVITTLKTGFRGQPESLVDWLPVIHIYPCTHTSTLSVEPHLNTKQRHSCSTCKPHNRSTYRPRRRLTHSLTSCTAQRAQLGHKLTVEWAVIWLL